jgi:hypothetical protein
VSEADAKRAATLATPEAWLATEEDGSTCVHPARVLMFRFLAAEMRSREAV